MLEAVAQSRLKNRAYLPQPERLPGCIQAEPLDHRTWGSSQNLSELALQCSYRNACRLGQFGKAEAAGGVLR